MITIEISKNMEPAPYMGERYGQDIEPSGTYVICGHVYLPRWCIGRAELRNPLFVNVTNETLVSWKSDLAQKYRAKKKRLTAKLQALRYDSIITIHQDHGIGEIVLFDNSKFILYDPD